MGKVKIDKGIEIPDGYDLNLLQRMESGDSFFIADADWKLLKVRMQELERVAFYASPRISLECRTWQNENDIAGFRIWRTS